MDDEAAPLRALIVLAVARLGRDASPEWIATAVLREILPDAGDMPLIRAGCRATLVRLAREALGLPDPGTVEPNPDSLRAEGEACLRHADALEQWRRDRAAE